jgi:SOS-response transcriptional repressor LexA
VPGALVLVDPAVQARSGDIVLVSRPNGGILFMRLSIVGGVYMFSFVNHKYAQKNSPATNLRIEGVALESVLVNSLRDLFISQVYA